MTRSNTTRRALLAGTGAGLALAGGRLATPALAQGGPIRMACIASLSGAQEVIGRPILIGAQIAAEEINKDGGINGRQVEIVARDDKANPNEALAAAREVIGDGVNMILGVVTSPNALALTAIMEPSNAILITCAAGSDKLTHENFNRHYFRVTDNTYMRQRAQGRIMAERYPQILDWGAAIPDAEYGRSAWNSFQDGIKEFYPKLAKAEPKIQSPVLTKFGATDYKNYVVSLMNLPIEGLFSAVYGGDAAALFQQARPYGLERKIKVIADSANEFIVPKALGKAVPPNQWIGTHWYFGGYQDQPMGKRLYEAYVARTGDRFPLGWLAEGHAAVYAYAAAIRKTGGTDTKTLITAMEGATFDTAKGRRTFRPEDHQSLCDVNIMQIQPASNDRGWDVTDFVRIDGRETVEEPTPGGPIKYRFS